MDPFRLALALVPLAAYLGLIGLISLCRRPLLTTGASDLATLGAALSGAAFVGPLALFRVEAATAEFGNYIWVFLLMLYWLAVSLVVLTSRPRLVIYNISIEELRPVIADAVSRLDPHARWAGDSLVLPALGVQFHLDSFPVMRNASLVSSGPEQSLEGWRRLAIEIRRSLDLVRVGANPRSAGYLIVAALLLVASIAYMLQEPQELARGIAQVFAFGSGRGS